MANDDFESKHARGPGGKFAPKGTADVSKAAQRISDRGRDKSTEAIARLKTAKDAIRQGGATVDPSSGEHVHEGYSVATYREHEHVADLGDIDVENDRDALAEKLSREMNAYVASKAHVFAADPNAKLGMWYDKSQKKYFFDVSTVVHSEASARQLGLKHDQIAIYDLKNNKEIRLGGRLK